MCSSIPKLSKFQCKDGLCTEIYPAWVYSSTKRVLYWNLPGGPHACHVPPPCTGAPCAPGRESIEREHTDEFSRKSTRNTFVCLLCLSRGFTLEKLEPRLFLGVCSTCDGLGALVYMDIKKIIPGDQLSHEDGANCTVFWRIVLLLYANLHSSCSYRKTSLYRTSSIAGTSLFITDIFFINALISIKVS